MSEKVIFPEEFQNQQNNSQITKILNAINEREETREKLDFIRKNPDLSTLAAYQNLFSQEKRSAKERDKGKQKTIQAELARLNRKLELEKLKTESVLIPENIDKFVQTYYYSSKFNEDSSFFEKEKNAMLLERLYIGDTVRNYTKKDKKISA